jgi:hypothetical protein
MNSKYTFIKIKLYSSVVACWTTLEAVLGTYVVKACSRVESRGREIMI